MSLFNLVGLWAIWLLPLTVLGQWKADVYYLEGKTVNTYIYLQSPPETSSGTTIAVDIRCKSKESHSFIYQKNTTLLVSEQGYALAELFLPKGVYTVSIDLKTAALQQFLLPYECGSKGSGFQASDILLSHFPIHTSLAFRPIIHEISPQADRIYFFMELYTVSPNPLTARAVLYRKQVGGNVSSTVYTSLEQINRVITTQSPKTLFAGYFQIDTLAEGDYLVEIRFYEDEELVWEKGEAFSIEWKGRNALLQMPDTALAMLCYLLPEHLLDSAKSLSGDENRRQAVLGLWDELYHKEAEAQMEQYYKRAFEANRLFKEKTAGWRTDRGRIYMLYGPPTHTKIETTVGKPFLVYWDYPEIGISFIFEQIDNNFQLVE